MTVIPGESIATRIHTTGATIYDQLDRDSVLYFRLPELEARLAAKLVGLQWDFPLRTRSKIGKIAVAEALGYTAPASFRKTQPRFPHQDLDLFLQQSDNLQIWNEKIDPQRRYALLRLDSSNMVTAVRVVTGESVALWDRTGTLTSKFQAARLDGRTGSKLVSTTDTANFRNLLAPAIPHANALLALSPAERPLLGSVLPIAEVHERLETLVGEEFVDPGLTNERGRGVVLQKLATTALGLGTYGDRGQFPDIFNQALEVKLQLSATIDLGIVSPDSLQEAGDLGDNIRHCDVRYAVFFGRRDGSTVTLEAVVTAVGSDFFTEFRRFEGLVSNRKLQIPLPSSLFDSERLPD